MKMVMCLVCLLIGGSLLNRYFLKQNDGFCIHNILGNVPQNPRWDTPLSPSLDPIFNQTYHYLAKGHQSYVFISEDQQYVIKFYRFPSHLRLFSWMSHPFASRLSSKRKEIIRYNLEKFDLTLNSYKIAYENLPEETGLLWIHLNPSTHLKKKIRLIDRSAHAYQMPLDPLCFVVQRKASLIFPTLEAMHDVSEREQLIDSLIHLIVSESQKGFRNTDPVLEKNYGWDGERALTIDVGRFVLDAQQKQPLVYEKEVRKITHPLALWLHEHNPELLSYYEDRIKRSIYPESLHLGLTSAQLSFWAADTRVRLHEIFQLNTYLHR